MCGRLVQVVVSAIGWLAVYPFGLAQLSDPVPEVPSHRVCHSSELDESDGKPEPGPEITLADLKFEGNLRLPQPEQAQIAAEIQKHQYSGAIEEAVDEIQERTRLGWQNSGYFNVEVSESSRKVLTSNPVSQRIALVLHVEEGWQYRLKRITFKNNRAIASLAALRSLFPIADGDIFDREKISQGLESLRKAYGELGYINFTSLPDTEVEEASATISLQIDLDEGKLFHVAKLEILGLDERALQQALKDLALKPGDVYKWGTVEWFLRMHPMPYEDFPIRQLDAESSTVALSFDFRPCSSD